MSRKHVHDRIDRLERRLAAAASELAELRAWRDGHACQPVTVYQPQPILPAAEPLCTCGLTWPHGCAKHGSTWISTIMQPTVTGGVSTVQFPPGTWTAVNTTGAAYTGHLTQVWPPKNPPDDPDMGVPAIA